MENFKQTLEEKVNEVNNIILEYAPAEEGDAALVKKSMNYSLMAGGKRLRPLIMMETCRMFGGDLESIKPYMAAIEMVHTYSLIHDDLPAMDNDEYRRGRKTNHVVFGEDIAILGGDALLNYAFETMLDAAYNDSKQAVKAMRILANKSGIHGMLGGQVIDVTTEGKAISLDTVLEIHKLKTAALLEASMMIGATIAGADDEQIECCERAANRLGLAFQIQDDILDVTSTTEELGKPVLSDQKNNKTTYVSLKGLEQSREDVKKYSEEAIEILSSIDGDSQFLRDLFDYLIDRKK